MWLPQAVREFEGQLADRAQEAQALERETENLEGQVEQLTISLMDATSKKTDSELRLRQFQQVRYWVCITSLTAQLGLPQDRHAVQPLHPPLPLVQRPAGLQVCLGRKMRRSPAQMPSGSRLTSPMPILRILLPSIPRFLVDSLCLAALGEPQPAAART